MGSKSRKRTLARKRKRLAQKKQVWDGEGFCELSWFWDPNAVWLLPAKFKTENCKNIITGKTILSFHASHNALRLGG